MAFACKICILEKGLIGSEISKLPQTEEELFDHIERVHHMPVTRQGETANQTVERFLKEYPEVLTCPVCIKAGALWTRRS